jgi:RHS repeat-associated protein
MQLTSSLETGPSFTYTHDHNGNVTQRTDTTGNTTTYSYDRLNRLTGEAFPGGRTNGYTYDANGNLASVTDGGGTVSYTYDGADRVKTITAPAPSGSGTETVEFFYKDTDDGGGPRHREQRLPGNGRIRVQRDRAGKTTEIRVTDSTGAVKRQLAYAYGTSPATQAKVVALAEENGDVTTYSYADPACPAEKVGRLLKARTMNGANLVRQYEFCFDAAGNRTTRTVQPAATTTRYGHNGRNELCWQTTTSGSGSTCTPAPSGATTYGYDANGNETSRGFAYDRLDRLAAIGSTSLSYLSPGNQELVAHGTEAYQNNLLGLGRIFGSSATTTFVRDPDSGLPVSQRTSSGSRHFLVADHLGSTLMLVNNTAATITRSFRYDPDGNDTTTGTGASTDIRYAGGHRLPSGLYHFAARFYDPDLARFTQQDPLDQHDDLTQANRYTYAAGDPVNNTDPSGLKLGRCNPRTGSGCSGGGNRAQRQALVTCLNPLDRVAIRSAGVGAAYGFRAGYAAGEDLGSWGRAGLASVSAGAGARIGHTIGGAYSCGRAVGAAFR